MKTEISKTGIFMIMVCAVSNLTYYPVFQSSSYARYIAIAMWMLLGVISLRRMIPIVPETQRMLFLYMCFLLTNVISMLSGNGNVFSNHFFSTVTVAIIIYFVGALNGEYFQESLIELICQCYMYISILMSFFLLIFYLIGTDLSSEYYSYEYGKNEIAILFVVAIAIACIMLERKNRIQSLLCNFGVILMIADILLMKCRTAMVCIAVILGVALIYKGEGRKKQRTALLVGIIIVIVILATNEELLNSFTNLIIFASREDTSLDSLSSGRLTQIAEGLQVFSDNFLIGVGSRKTLDCFYVSALANYGIMAFPLILLAIYPFFWGLRRLYYHRDRITVCYFTIATCMIIVSIFEELAPFGPGIRCYIMWLLFGLIVGNEYGKVIYAED